MAMSRKCPPITATHFSVISGEYLRKTSMSYADVYLINKYWHSSNVMNYQLKKETERFIPVFHTGWRLLAHRLYCWLSRKLEPKYYGDHNG